jgi:hypothetical protein
MRHGVVTALLLAVAAVAWAADQVVIEDWTSQKVGSKGIPAGWKGQNWGSPTYDMTVVDDGGRRALHMVSRDDGSTIARDIKGKVNLKETPVLEWNWKAVTLPQGGDSRRKATDDQAVQIFVVWPRFPEAVRSRIIGYVWDSTAPVGTVVKSEKTGTVTYVVVRSGPRDLGKWFTERRNLVEDYRAIHKEDPDDAPAVLSIAIDSNDTHSSAESFVGAVLFRKP